MSGAHLDPFSPYQQEFSEFALAEARKTAPPNPVLFYGSSSVRLWTDLANDFPDFPVVNRGFGGSTLQECVQEMDWLVIRLRPRAIVLYAGENDLDHGSAPEAVLHWFQVFAARVAEELGSVPMVVISAKPSPARWWLIEQLRRTNALLQSAVASIEGAVFLNVFDAMLDGNGRPRRELYHEDGLHLSRAGYDLWAEKVRTVLCPLL